MTFIAATQNLTHTSIHKAQGLHVATVWAEDFQGDSYRFEERGYANPQTALDWVRSWAPLPLEGDSCDLPSPALDFDDYDDRGGN